jgi:hypothetical protein
LNPVLGQAFEKQRSGSNPTIVVAGLHRIFGSVVAKTAMHFPISKSLIATKAFALCAIAVSLCAVASCAEANRTTQNSARGASAALHLTVFVIPVLQARPEAASPKQGVSSITFTFAKPALNGSYDVRTFSPAESKHAGRQQPAILRTLTIVPK